MKLQRKVIAALDTGRVDEAVAAVERLAPHVGGFKVGHGLVLPNGLGILDRLREAGAKRIFLDLKFHDIPNSVALAVREATHAGVWMMTLHASGGPAMMTAAVEEARSVSEERQPILLAVSVLTSLDERNLQHDLGVSRSVTDHMVALSEMAVRTGVDGVVSSPNEVKLLRQVLGHAVIVTPGIRRQDQTVDDHQRTGLAQEALSDGADYLVIGRGLMTAPDPEVALAAYGLADPTVPA